MKKLIYLMALGLLVNIGCTKEQNAVPKEGSENPQESFYVYNMGGETPGWELVSADAMQLSSEQNSAEKSNSNSAHAHGDYTGFGGGTTISFSGTENNGGAHGSAEVWQASGPFEAHYTMETTSMVVDDNYAIYGGVITEVFVNTFPPPPPPPPGVPAPPCSPNSVGNYVYFTVYDNGQGSNASIDQYRGLTQSCFVKSDGGVSFPWFIFGQPSDVMNSSDKIKVN
jgi:hypothetical protein